MYQVEAMQSSQGETYPDFLSRLGPSSLHKKSDDTKEKLPLCKLPMTSLGDVDKENKPIKQCQCNSPPKIPLHSNITGTQDTDASDKENIFYSKGNVKNDCALGQQEQHVVKNELINKLTMWRRNNYKDKPSQEIPAFCNVITKDKLNDELHLGKRQNDELAIKEKVSFNLMSERSLRCFSKFPSTSMLQSHQNDAKPTQNLHEIRKDRIFSNAFSCEAKQRKKCSLVVDGKSASAPMNSLFLQSDRSFQPQEPPANCSQPVEEESGEQRSSSRTVRTHSSMSSFEKLPLILQRFQRSAAAIPKIFSPTNLEVSSEDDDDDDDDHNDEEENIAHAPENESEDVSDAESIADKSSSSKLDVSKGCQENRKITSSTETQKEVPVLHKCENLDDIQNDQQNPNAEEQSFDNCERNREVKASSQNNRAVHTDTPRNARKETNTSGGNSVTCNNHAVPTKENAPFGYKSVQTVSNLDRSLRANRMITVNDKNYLKLNILGKGGSSKVYLVYDEEKKQLLAVKKVCLVGAEPAVVEGYKNEIKLLLKLQQCDRVIKLFDYEYRMGDKEILVVMEKGDTDLANALRSVTSSEPLTPIMIKFYWSEMLKAVREIHEQGIIHSDLKPANFLLVSGKLKLIDFGISSSVQKDTTSIIKDCQAGTINFMPPEALQGLCHPYDQASSSGGRMFKINRKADIWSLGCILYNVVYGRTPFHHIPNTISKLQAIINPNYKIEFPPIEDTVLLTVLKSCLTRDPAKRPSIDDLLEDPYIKLYGCASNVPLPAKFSSMWHQMQQLTPRTLAKLGHYAIHLSTLKKSEM